MTTQHTTTTTNDYTLEAFLFRWLLRVLLGVVLLAALLYIVDFAVWRIRVADHGGMGTVTVTRVITAELKGSKEGYYSDGTSDVSCSRSLFPQGGVNACWWQQRNREIVERY
ncbi:MAG: hypothetical protein ABI142_08675 [Bryocella sp.]